MVDLRFHARRGQLEEVLEAEGRAIRGATENAVKKTTDRIKRQARSRVRAALSGQGRGRRVENSIRSKLYKDPDGGFAGIVYSKFGRREGGRFVDYLEPFITGATLRPTSGQWLYISMEKGRKGQRRRLSASLDPKVNWIPSSDGRAIWLVRQTRRRTTLIAKLVRVVRMPRRLNLAGLERVAERSFPLELIKELDETRRQRGAK